MKNIYDRINEGFERKYGVNLDSNTRPVKKSLNENKKPTVKKAAVNESKSTVKKRPVNESKRVLNESYTRDQEKMYQRARGAVLADPDWFILDYSDCDNKDLRELDLLAYQLFFDIYFDGASMEELEDNGWFAERQGVFTDQYIDTETGQYFEYEADDYAKAVTEALKECDNLEDFMEEMYEFWDGNVYMGTSSYGKYSDGDDDDDDDDEDEDLDESSSNKRKGVKLIESKRVLNENRYILIELDDDCNVVSSKQVDKNFASQPAKASASNNTSSTSDNIFTKKKRYSDMIRDIAKEKGIDVGESLDQDVSEEKKTGRYVNVVAAKKSKARKECNECGDSCKDCEKGEKGEEVIEEGMKNSDKLKALARKYGIEVGEVDVKNTKYGVNESRARKNRNNPSKKRGGGKKLTESKRKLNEGSEDVYANARNDPEWKKLYTDLRTKYLNDPVEITHDSDIYDYLYDFLNIAAIDALGEGCSEPEGMGDIIIFFAEDGRSYKWDEPDELEYAEEALRENETLQDFLDEMRGFYYSMRVRELDENGDYVDESLKANRTRRRK